MWTNEGVSTIYDFWAQWESKLSIWPLKWIILALLSYGSLTRRWADFLIFNPTTRFLHALHLNKVLIFRDSPKKCQAGKVRKRRNPLLRRCKLAAKRRRQRSRSWQKGLKRWTARKQKVETDLKEKREKGELGVDKKTWASTLPKPYALCGPLSLIPTTF